MNESLVFSYVLLTYSRQVVEWGVSRAARFGAIGRGRYRRDYATGAGSNPERGDSIRPCVPTLSTKFSSHTGIPDSKRAMI